MNPQFEMLLALLTVSVYAAGLYLFVLRRSRQTTRTQVVRVEKRR